MAHDAETTLFAMSMEQTERDAYYWTAQLHNHNNQCMWLDSATQQRQHRNM